MAKLNININKLDNVAHTYNPITQEAQVRLQVQGQPEIHCKLKASLGYKMRSCLKFRLTN